MATDGKWALVLRGGQFRVTVDTSVAAATMMAAASGAAVPSCVISTEVLPSGFHSSEIGRMLLSHISECATCRIHWHRVGL